MCVCVGGGGGSHCGQRRRPEHEPYSYISGSLGCAVMLVCD